MLKKILTVTILTTAANADTQADQCHIHLQEGVHFNLCGLKSKNYEAVAVSKDFRTVRWSYFDDNPTFSYLEKNGSNEV